MYLATNTSHMLLEHIFISYVSVILKLFLSELRKNAMMMLFRQMFSCHRPSIKEHLLHYSNNDWGICITPRTRRPTVHQRISRFSGVQMKSQISVFSGSDNESVDRSSFRTVGSLLHSHDAITDKALSPVCRHVHGTTR